MFRDAVGGLGGAEWDRLAGDRFYSSRGWLEFCASLDGHTGGAVCVEDAGRRAAVPVSAVTRQAHTRYRWDALLRDLGTSEVPAGVLVGPARGYQTHILSAAQPHTGLVERLLDRLRRLPEHAAAAGLLGDAPPQRPPVMAMFLSTAEAEALRAAGVRRQPVLLGADAWFTLPDGGWEGWLDSLSAKRRSMVRRDLRRFDEAGCTVRHAPLEDVVDVAAELQARTDERYGRRAPAEAIADSFRRQAAAAGGAARAALCCRDGRIIGYCAYLLRGRTLFLRSAGFDYTRLNGVAEYFTTVYYSPIRAAVRAGARHVHAGIAAEDAKALRGADLHPLWLLDLTPGSRGTDRDEPILARNAEVSARVAALSPAVERAWTPQARSAEQFGLARSLPSTRR
ncbi:GNAT family N-acetyltransferase [Streptomonospora alba]|uniref:GNAT family N-acetyltransferase n=1 Tax=Streptomonospora alba TaxID=183763 RepID=UPI00069CBE47|nr:GNAT family N-acetyltransferase [Streptomonospora alba]